MKGMQIMKKTMMKILSVMLAVLLLAPAYAALVPADAAGLTPVVYIHGDSTIYKYNEDGTKTKLFDDGEYMSAILDGAVPLIAKAIISGDWSEYNQHVLDIVLPAFEGFAPAPDGTLPENTGTGETWDPATLRPDYRLRDGRLVYMFISDFRLSPMDIADEIEAYVEAVKAKTGSSKVFIFGRCGGASVMAAYLEKYAKPENYADIEGVCFINSSALGTEYADAVMSGNVQIPVDGAYRFMSNLDSYIAVEELGLEAELIENLKTVFEMLHETYGINVTADLVQRIYEKEKDDLLAPIIKAYWGISGAYVASTVNRRYEDYKDYVFPTEEDKAEYAPIIEKLDDFHYNVQEKLPEDILAMKDAGVMVNVFVEYGTQQYPLSEKTEYVGDYMLSVEDQSFGATTSKVDETLSEAYIAAQTEKGLDKYISPDKQIDASTCLLPDNTWFMKNMIHDFPAALDNLIDAVIANPANTVWTIEAYPQYLNYNKENGTLLPAQEENENDMEWENPDPGSGTRGFIEIMKGLLEKIIAFVKGLIEGIKGHATGTIAPLG